MYLKPYRMTSERIGDGTIDIARALKAMLPKAKLNDVTAQHSLVTRQTMEMGRNRKIHKEVDEVLHTNGQDLVGQVLPVLQDSRRYVIITGGGAVLLRDMLLDRLAIRVIVKPAPGLATEAPRGNEFRQSFRRHRIRFDHLADRELADFYGSLFESEARHHSTYVRLAKDFMDEESVHQRLRELAEAEGAIIAAGEEQPRMHS